jgi:hypothetical protein
MSYYTDLPVSCQKTWLQKKPAQLGMNSGTTTAQLTWQVPDVDIAQFMAVVSGLKETIVLPGNPPSTVQRIVPLRHPRFTNLLADSAQAVAKGFAPNGDPTLGNWWSSWDVQVDFRTPQFNVDGSDPFLTISARPSGRTIAMPASAATFSSDSSHPVIDPGVFIPGWTYEITINGAPTFDEAFYNGYLRTINTTTFRNCAPGTVLFPGPALNRTVTIGNVARNSITFAFEVSALNWNLQGKSDGTTDTLNFNGTPWYSSKDFNLLLSH